MIEKLKVTVVILVFFGMIIGICYGSWWIRRTFNWNFYGHLTGIFTMVNGSIE